MDGLPPPGGEPAADQPTPAPTPAKQPMSREMWLLLIGAGFVVIVLAGVFSGDDDDPPAPSRQEIAEQVWEDTSLTERAVICDGYRIGGESFTVDNLLAGTDGDEDVAEAMLDVIRGEC